MIKRTEKECSIYLLRRKNIDMGITSILSLLSGVALFLFGMSLMGDGLKKAAGEKLELILYYVIKRICDIRK